VDLGWVKLSALLLITGGIVGGCQHCWHLSVFYIRAVATTRGVAPNVPTAHSMKREEQLPKVIASGDFWEGWCDYQC
jgi:hypothetical protein